MRTWSCHSGFCFLPCVSRNLAFAWAQAIREQEMELISLRSSPVTVFFSSRSVLLEKPTFLTGPSLTIPKMRRCPGTKSLKLFDFRAQSSGSLQGTTKDILEATNTVKQEGIVFVAGATGKVGSRTVRELLKLGFWVRAGVRSKQKAETLLQSVQQMKIDGVAVSTSGNSIPIVEKLEIVECDLEKRDEIGPAISNASVVICCIGASEKEVFDVTGPYRIDYQATKNLIDAATVAKVNHFILLTSLGTNKIGFPAAILNLFWGVLIWKRKAEVALIASGLPFTIVRPGGMERPTDAYKETHNIVLASEDTYFGGQVSNLQVAELMAFMAKSRDLSSYKVVEVIAETTAPLLPMEELLAKISSKHDSLLKKEQTVPKTKPTSPQTVESEPSIIAVEKEKVQTEVQNTSPLSPYVAYDDLKPLTSPTPTPSSTPSAPKAYSVNAIEADSRPGPPPQISVLDPTSNGPLSPYIAYDDLKPPTSPTPTPSSTSSDRKEKPLNAVPPSSLSLQPEVVVSELKPTHAVEDLRVQNQKSRPLSPYYVYEDLKPPTSPSPNAPTVFSSNI